MAVAWAHQDCSKPFNQSKQRAKKVRQLRAQVTELKNKLGAKEEELKNNEIELVARNERLRGPKLRSSCLRGSSPGSMLITSHYRTIA